MGLRWKYYPLQIMRMYSAEQRTKAIAIPEFPPIPSTWNFPLFMIFATEDWMQGWELHRPSTRPSSSNMLIVASPRPCPRSRPCGFWMVSQETGADFVMGPELLGGFRRGLFAVGLADLGKRRRVAVFRAGSACETAQKLQAGFARAEGSASKHVFQPRRRWSQAL